MAQFGGNKNPPWAQQGGRQGPPGGGPGAQPGGGIDVPGLVGAFGAAANAGQAGPPVFHQGGGGLPPGLGVGHLGVPGGHGPAVTLAAMAGQPVSSILSLFFSKTAYLLCFLVIYLRACVSRELRVHGNPQRLAPAVFEVLNITGTPKAPYYGISVNRSFKFPNTGPVFSLSS